MKKQSFPKTISAKNFLLYIRNGYTQSHYCPLTFFIQKNLGLTCVIVNDLVFANDADITNQYKLTPWMKRFVKFYSIDGLPLDKAAKLAVEPLSKNILKVNARKASSA